MCHYLGESLRLIAHNIGSVFIKNIVVPTFKRNSLMNGVNPVNLDKHFQEIKCLFNVSHKKYFVLTNWLKTLYYAHSAFL